MKEQYGALSIFLWATVAACSYPTDVELDWGTCVPEAEAAATVQGIRFEVDVDPRVVDYAELTSVAFSVTNTSGDAVEMGAEEECVVQIWIRGERPIHQPECRLTEVRQGPLTTDEYRVVQRFRPLGAMAPLFRGDPRTGYQGTAAPPGTYCFVADVALADERARIEVPFELRELPYDLQLTRSR